MRRMRATVIGSLVVGLLWFLPAHAMASVVGDWQLDEAAGSTTMVDASANALHGNIGSDVVLHEATPTSFGYRFLGPWWIVNDNRLVTWADDARLDPGTQPFAVTIRIKTGARDPNIIQKGQDNQTGGYWKLALKKGWPRCHFEDASHRSRAIGFVNDVRPEAMVADGQWHTLRCEKTPTGVRMTINYGEPNAISKFLRGTLGTIDNNREMTLGGKLYCDGATVTCDYYAGAVDSLTIERPGL